MELSVGLPRMHKEACERRDFLPGLVWFLSRAGFGNIVFDVGDPAGSEVPESIPNVERRAVVSCYSSPGVHPKACMELYGTQLAPLLETLVERGGLAGVRPNGSFHERALYRGSLRAWLHHELVEA